MENMVSFHDKYQSVKEAVFGKDHHVLCNKTQGYTV
jgi:hypothetical protein